MLSFSADAGVFLLCYQPGKLTRELLAGGLRQVEFKQEAAVNGVANEAVESAYAALRLARMRLLEAQADWRELNQLTV